MGPQNGVNLERVDYFSIEEYVDKIKLRDNVLWHIEDTNEQFDKYIRKLKKFSPYAILYFLISSFRDEMVNSNKIEKHLIDPLEITEKNMLIENGRISNKRIKELHEFVMKDDENFSFDYRNDIAWVGYIENGEKNVYWYGAEAKDIKNFMNDFIEIYKNRSLSFIDSNPFIKSALVHLLFVRIHPFGDGNGRTARLIHNIKFTELINKAYNFNLKISPLHLSQSILLNQRAYVQRINDIYFDIKHDSNDEINKWFDYILNMYDEQLYFMVNHLNGCSEALNNISLIPSGNDSFEKVAVKLNLKK